MLSIIRIESRFTQYESGKANEPAAMRSWKWTPQKRQKKDHRQQGMQAILFYRFIFNHMIFYPKTKVKDMEQPYCTKNRAGNVKGFLKHDQEAE